MKDNLCKCLCGIADEAGHRLEQQFEVHRQLGWELIELRTIDGTPVSSLTQQSFNCLAAAIGGSGMRVVALDTGIGGWKRTVLSPLSLDLEELKKSAERAHRLRTRFLRVMSFPNQGLPEEEWKERALDRMACLVREACAADVVLLHENCIGWASQGSQQTIEMLRRIDSPNLGLLFDIGNPLVYGQDGLQFLNAVVQWVRHVHIKDAILQADGNVRYMLPGSGQAGVGLCVWRLFQSGYQGAFSIEPHLACLPHLDMASDEITRRSTYLSYGRQFRTLMQGLLNPERDLI
jgi:L-ribulose-5-phosphate 3-epimerase